MVLVDTNVLLDVFEDDPRWASWSQEKLESTALADQLMINAVIYAELSVAFARIEELEEVIAQAALSVEPIPREACGARQNEPGSAWQDESGLVTGLGA